MKTTNSYNIYVKKNRFKKTIAPFIGNILCYCLLQLFFVQMARGVPVSAEREIIKANNDTVTSGSLLTVASKGELYLNASFADIQIIGMITDENGDSYPTRDRDLSRKGII